MVILTYTRAELLDYGSTRGNRPPVSMRWWLGYLFVQPPRRRMGRGCRAGWKLQRPISVISSLRHPQSPILQSSNYLPSLLVHPRIEHHAKPLVLPLRAGLLKIRSINNKLDNVLDFFDEFLLNVLILTETWHEDMDSVAIRRPWGMGLNIMEAARALPPSSQITQISSTTADWWSSPSQLLRSTPNCNEIFQTPLLSYREWLCVVHHRC